LFTAVIKKSDFTTPVGRKQGFRLLLTGSSVSMLGSRVTTLAYPMLVLYLTGSPVIAGWTAFAATVPSMLAYIPAGALVDRSDPWRTMLCSELGRGVAIAMVVFALALGSPSVLLLVVVAIIEGILAVFSTLAERRYVRSLVEPCEASSALVQSEARTHMAVLIGRPLGGFLFELRPILPFLVDVATFIFSVGVLGWIRLTQGAGCASDRSGGGPRRHLGSEIRDGLRWLRKDRFARVAMPLSASTTLIAQALIMIFIAEAHAQRFSAVVLGIVLAASGAGGAVGSMAVPRLADHPLRPRLQTLMWWWAPAFVLLVLSDGRSFFWMAVAMVFLGFTGAFGNIELDTYLIQNVDEQMLARVMSIGRLMSFGACAVGPLAGGILAQWHRPRLALIWLLALVITLAITATVYPRTTRRRIFAVIRCAQLAIGGTLLGILWYGELVTSMGACFILGALDAGEVRLSVLDSGKPPQVLVPAVDERAHDGPDILDRGEVATGDGLASDDREEALDEVESGAAC
jgi:MFS family permease